MPSPSDRLTTVTNLVFICSCIILLGVVGYRQLSTRALPERQALAEFLPASTKIAWHESGPAVIVVLSSTCRFCVDSMPLYRELIARAPSGIKTVFAGLESQPVLVKFLVSNGVQPVHVQTVPLMAPFRGTPSLVVLDRDGRVAASWEGRLSTQQHDRLMSLLDGMRQSGD